MQRSFKCHLVHKHKEGHFFLILLPPPQVVNGTLCGATTVVLWEKSNAAGCPGI